MEEDQARPGQLLDAEQVQFLAQLAVVALLGFFQLIEVGIQVLLAEEGRAVDALHLGVLLVAPPVGAGDGQHLEGLDVGGRGNVRAAAEVDEPRAEGVLGEDVSGTLLDQLALHVLAHRGVLLEALGLGRHAPFVGEVLLLQLPHLRLDLLEVLRRERRVALEIVVEAVVGGRADPELGLRIEFHHGRRQQVRGGVPVDLHRLRISRSQNLKRGIGFERAREIGQFAVHLGGDGVLRQPRANRLRHVDGTRPSRNGPLAAIRQSHSNAAHSIDFSAYHSDTLRSFGGGPMALRAIAMQHRVICAQRVRSHRSLSSLPPNAAWPPRWVSRGRSWSA